MARTTSVISDEMIAIARCAAYRAVGLFGHEAACVRYDRALTAALASLAEQGVELKLRDGLAGPNDIEATGQCCCAGCVGMGPCDRSQP